jgi:hypothetical protein
MFLMANLPIIETLEKRGKIEKTFNFRQLVAKTSHIQGNKNNKIKEKIERQRIHAM